MNRGGKRAEKMKIKERRKKNMNRGGKRAEKNEERESHFHT
jgi:hypothetical protein